MPRQLHTDDSFEVCETDLQGIPNADPAVFYTVRAISVQKHREIQRKHTTQKPDPRTRQMVSVTDLDAVADDVTDFILTGWRGIELHGQPAECSRENKLKLDAFVRVALEQLAGTNRTDAAQAAKESSFR
jgi:hypothetical protein